MFLQTAEGKGPKKCAWAEVAIFCLKWSKIEWVTTTCIDTQTYMGMNNNIRTQFQSHFLNFMKCHHSDVKHMIIISDQDCEIEEFVIFQINWSLEVINSQIRVGDCPKMF